MGRDPAARTGASSESTPSAGDTRPDRPVRCSNSSVAADRSASCAPTSSGSWTSCRHSHRRRRLTVGHAVRLDTGQAARRTLALPLARRSGGSRLPIPRAREPPARSGPCRAHPPGIRGRRRDERGGSRSLLRATRRQLAVDLEVAASPRRVGAPTEELLRPISTRRGTPLTVVENVVLKLASDSRHDTCLKRHLHIVKAAPPWDVDALNRSILR